MEKINNSKQIMLVRFFVLIFIGGMTETTGAEDTFVQSELYLKTTKSWDGSEYLHYPEGKPEITVLKVIVPPKTELSWHTHPVISVVYLLAGKLNVIKKETGEKILFKSGDIFGDTVDILHQGYTEDIAAEMIVFFAGTPGVPLREPDKSGAY